MIFIGRVLDLKGMQNYEDSYIEFASKLLGFTKYYIDASR